MNEQEEFWAGKFGEEYTIRQRIEAPGLKRFFRQALAKTERIDMVLELGANAGYNLAALRSVLGNHVYATGVEINPLAFKQLEMRADRAVLGSILERGWSDVYDLVMTKGVLIHIAPDDLPAAYKAMVESTRRYILVAEYFAREPTPVEYRGHTAKLWRRDFAGEMLELYKGELVLLDYGFAYHRDPLLRQDSINWFLMERTKNASEDPPEQ
jgi:pseudaminic acid biosynthesis-associated methylase